MKQFALSLVIATALAGTSAMAQSYNSSDAPAVLNRASVFYDLNTLYPKDGDNVYFNGYGVGYNIDVRVSKTLPLYIGTGIDVRFVFHNENINENLAYDPVWMKAQCTLINFNLPVNVSYRMPVADKFYLTPFIGLDFRLQAYGNASLSIAIPEGSPQEVVDWAESVNDDVNLFSSDDMGSAHLRRFQMGWHAGLNFEYNRLTLGLSYGTDFVKLHKNLGGSNFLVSLGYRF